MFTMQPHPSASTDQAVDIQHSQHNQIIELEVGHDVWPLDVHHFVKFCTVGSFLLWRNGATSAGVKDPKVVQQHDTEVIVLEYLGKHVAHRNISHVDDDSVPQSMFGVAVAGVTFTEWLWLYPSFDWHQQEISLELHHRLIYCKLIAWNKDT